MKLEKLKVYLLSKISDEVPNSLVYHNVHHTIAVYDAVIRIATSEKVSTAEIELLKAAALLHDTGFTELYEGHEKVSCRIAVEVLPYFDYSNKQIETICEIIMATKMPQTPLNYLGEIICDADLDHLGTLEFPSTANRLYEELISLGMVRNKEQWSQIQIEFLQKHQYFTKSSQKNREPIKQEHLEQLLAETTS